MIWVHAPVLCIPLRPYFVCYFCAYIPVLSDTQGQVLPTVGVPGAESELPGNVSIYLFEAFSTVGTAGEDEEQSGSKNNAY